MSSHPATGCYFSKAPDCADIMTDISVHNIGIPPLAIEDFIFETVKTAFILTL